MSDCSSPSSYMSISSHFNHSTDLSLQNTISSPTTTTVNESLSNSQNFLNTSNICYYNNNKRDHQKNNNYNNHEFQQLKEKYEKIKLFLNRVIENQKKTINDIANELKYFDTGSLYCFLQNGNSKWPRGLMTPFFRYVKEHDTLFNESTEEFKAFVKIDSKDDRNITQSSIEYSAIENVSESNNRQDSESNNQHNTESSNHVDSESISTDSNIYSNDHHNHHHHQNHHSHPHHHNHSHNNSSPSTRVIVLSDKNTPPQYTLTLETEIVKKKFAKCDEEVKKIYLIMINLIANLKLNSDIEDLSDTTINTTTTTTTATSTTSTIENRQETNQTMLCSSKLPVQQSPSCIVEESLFKLLHEHLTKHTNK